MVKSKVLSLLGIWEAWAAFSLRYLEGVKFTLLFDGESVLFEIPASKREVVKIKAEKEYASLDLGDGSEAVITKSIKYGLFCDGDKNVFKQKYCALKAYVALIKGLEEEKEPEADPEIDGLPWDGEEFMYVDQNL